MEPIVKVPMRTYRGKLLNSYSKEELIQIVEKVWALYANTSEENAMLIGLPSLKQYRTTRHIMIWAIILFGIATAISLIRILG